MRTITAVAIMLVMFPSASLAEIESTSSLPHLVLGGGVAVQRTATQRSPESERWYVEGGVFRFPALLSVRYLPSGDSPENWRNLGSTLEHIQYEDPSFPHGGFNLRDSGQIYYQDVSRFGRYEFQLVFNTNTVPGIGIPVRSQPPHSICFGLFSVLGLPSGRLISRSPIFPSPQNDVFQGWCRAVLPTAQGPRLFDPQRGSTLANSLVVVRGTFLLNPDGLEIVSSEIVSE